MRSILSRINNNIGFPSYSRDDNLIIHNGSTSATADHLQTTPIDASKISGRGTQTKTEIREAEWGVWFSNGQRDFNSGLFETDVIIDQIKVFPNPASDDITLQLNKAHGGISKIEIYDLLGRKVHSTGYEKTKFLSEVSVDIEHLESGIYNLLCTTKENVFSAQFVK